MVTQQKSQGKKADTAEQASSSAGSKPAAKAAPTPTVAVVGAARSVQRRILAPRTPPTAAPETVTFSVDLPAHVHEAPDHEVAVAIHDVPVYPGVVEPTTTSVAISAVATTAIPTIDETPAVPEIVPLPEPEPAPYTRRESLRGRSARRIPAARVAGARSHLGERFDRGADQHRLIGMLAGARATTVKCHPHFACVNKLQSKLASSCRTVKTCIACPR